MLNKIKIFYLNNKTEIDTIFEIAVSIGLMYIFVETFAGFISG